jgi:hypothetical protein
LLGTVEDLAGAGGEETAGQLDADRGGLFRVSFHPVANPLAAVREPDERLDRDSALVHARVNADRRRAGCFKQRNRGALGGQL